MKKWKLKILKHRNKINSFANIARSFSDFAFTKSPLSFISGSLLTLQELLGLKTWSAFDILNTSTNWYSLSNNKQLVNILSSILKNLPSKSLEFEHEETNLYEVEKIPFISIGERFREGGSDLTILVQKENKEKLLSILVEEKIKELNSNYLSLYEPEKDSDDLILNKFDIKLYSSEKAQSYINQLHNAFDKELKRSFIFVGLPGTGKTTIAYTILDHFKFRTLKFRPMNFFNLNTMLEFIDLFKIEAIILDDMDRFDIDDQLLEFLEAINKNVKLVIGVCNSLKELDPAILRPGRFDEIIKIEKLDNETIKSVLKEIYDEYKDKVEQFPIAYIQELYNQYLLDKNLLDIKYEDLAQRVINLHKSYLDPKIDDEELEEIND